MRGLGVLATPVASAMRWSGSARPSAWTDNTLGPNPELMLRRSLGGGAVDPTPRVYVERRGAFASLGE
jgi:hypothetical protein